jgi:hypothetical protein
MVNKTKPQQDTGGSSKAAARNDLDCDGAMPKWRNEVLTRLLNVEPEHSTAAVHEWRREASEQMTWLWEEVNLQYAERMREADSNRWLHLRLNQLMAVINSFRDGVRQWGTEYPEFPPKSVGGQPTDSIGVEK